MNNIAGALYRVIKIKKTKWSAAGEWGQCHASVSSNSHVFKRLRKVSSDGASLTAGGRLFQARAAAWNSTYLEDGCQKGHVTITAVDPLLSTTVQCY